MSEAVYAADHLGSTVATIDGASGAVLSRQQYYPFGAARTGTAPEKGYTGQQKEGADTSSLGLYYYHARFYPKRSRDRAVRDSPLLGHFVSADSLAVDGLNRYAYVVNNPILHTDDSGNCIDDCTPDPDDMDLGLRHNGVLRHEYGNPTEHDDLHALGDDAKRLLR